MRRILLYTLICTVLASLFWFRSGPYRALRHLQEAAAAGDVVALNRYADLPAVQVGLHEQLLALAARPGRHLPDAAKASGNSFRLVAVSAANTWVDALVASALQPRHLAALVRGHCAAAFGQEPEPAAQPGEEENGPMQAGVFESMDRYTLCVLDPDTHAPAVTLTLRRTGLTWRLTAVQLPFEAVQHTIPVAAY
ncbi:DUF2939 domain-containing protein [Hymenobacter sp. BT491]|uniref:DUF2939 domain-containing protein n=1 Tax=Hymenobacter sp. BT491 TaxID=2766779 RepID=UPI001653B912|nr:DUF2939 domain-containing protein [Hymenobacter sp. BT491]MBC6989594.1 DUF2939 domain-containing protein [Hymenobacter sp. BT491]